jgi:Tfp pilus assembly protein PilF
MKIIHKIDTFLAELFPTYKQSNNDLEILKAEIAKYYSIGPYIPVVSITGDLITIDIDAPTIWSQDADYRKVVSFCEKGNYPDAKPILKNLIAKNPTNSEYHRIMGQILSDEGDQEEAINYLIDALRWNPKNGYALTMMGNIFIRINNDTDTAIKYYNQALVVNPEDYIAICNIGANLLRLNKAQESIEYLKKAYTIKPSYPNAAYGLYMAYLKLDLPLVAFDYGIKCMKANNDPRDGMYQSVYKSVFKLATELSNNGNGAKVFEQYKTNLQRKTGKQIIVEEVPDLKTAAKIEFAEYYDRPFHTIKFKPGSFAVDHLKMHELVHLEFANEARAAHCNMLFLSGHEMKAQFMRDFEKDMKRMSKEGYKQETVDIFYNSLYEGNNNQAFNAPIDLFIEDYLFQNYPELQPYQFLSLQQIINNGMESVTNKKAKEIVPRSIHTASKILNMVNAIQFKDLYGIDTLQQFNALPTEMKAAEGMWAEYLDYRQDRKPGEKYEIVQHWGEDLKLDAYFQLVDEEDYRARPKTVEDLLASIEEDPYGLDVDKNQKEKDLQTFFDAQERLGTNIAVMWFMVSALKLFSTMSKAQVKAIAFEIATIGTQGINPSSSNKYRVNSIPGKEFSGYNLLAYYYVSWALAMPEMLPELGLNYEKEYEMAINLKNN